MSKLSIRVTLPVAILLLAQVWLYVCMAPRGFDFTDESFYFLNYLYWRNPIGAVSFFGAYFEWPFRMLGQSVPAIRIFSLLLLLASSAFFAREALGIGLCFPSRWLYERSALGVRFCRHGRASLFY